jgi:cytochrome oxidase assembly protein ShyY1
VGLALVCIAFTYLCFTVLAPWQLGKNTKTSRENQQITDSLNTPPVPLTDLLPQQNSSGPGSQPESRPESRWRQVTATGHYLPNVRVLARLRPVEGDQAFEVLAPFAVDGGPTVLVDRGYVRPEQGSHVPPIPPAPDQTVTVTGRLRDSEPTLPGKEPFTRDGFQQVYSISTEQVSALTGIPLARSYLQLVEDQPGGLGVIDLPRLDAGPFLSYGIQWILFGVLAPIALGYFVYAEVRARRWEKQSTLGAEPRRSGAAAAGESPGADDAASAGDERTSADPAQPVTPMTVEEKLANRYGRRR